jgi:murein DD-endopeptidase MepM/ murein hydrolase activator NlpD
LFLLFVSLLFVSLSGCPRGGYTPPNFAAAFGWRGYADTDVSLSSLGNEYTIAFRFMLQYPNAFVAPLISDSASGNFYIAKNEVDNHLIVNFNGSKRTVGGTSFDARVWHHLTIVRKDGKFTIYINGAMGCAALSSCTIPAGWDAASGVLRLGRAADNITINGREPQFYGFIDDVAVFKKALDAGEIEALASKHRLTGREAGLFAGYTFDSGTVLEPVPILEGKLPVMPKGAVTLKTKTPGTVMPGRPAYTALVSHNRNSAFDAKFLPVPFQQKSMRLPFPKGEAWEVVQGWDNLGGSHKGAASFCWDFILAGKPTLATNGKPIHAAAGGKVVEIRNDRDSCAGAPASYVMIEHAPVEIGAYLHFVKGSVVVNKDEMVVTGKRLANAGDTGNAPCGGFHLHYSLHTLPESQSGTLVTFPSAFNDYDVSTDKGATWNHVDRGVPKFGEWVRNP